MVLRAGTRRLVALHGAMKNVGDFLIRERALALIRHVRPEHEIVLHPRWEALDDALLAGAEAVVLCGGPGLREDFYPETFRMVPDLRALRIPVLPLALGWSGQPADHPERFAFDDGSREALSAILQTVGWGSVRDDVSLGIVERSGVGAFRRTGCAAWYDLPSLGTPVRLPAKVGTLVFTPPAASRRLFAESLRLMRLLRSRYKDADRFCVFHRGLRADRFTSKKESAAVLSLAAAATALGFKVVDAAFDLERIAFYRDADLHVGYRVHAHLAFVSYRRPTLLVAEDGRGLGQAETLGDEYRIRAGRSETVAQVANALSQEERLGHPALTRAVDEVERTWPVMRETLEQLPS
jgi:Polysaccharide pyruvyl transferase